MATRDFRCVEEEDWCLIDTMGDDEYAVEVAEAVLVVVALPRIECPLPLAAEVVDEVSSEELARVLLIE